MIRHSVALLDFSCEAVDHNSHIVLFCTCLQMTTKARQYLSWSKSEKVGLKLNIQKTKIMASGPITSWEIDGETVETVPDFIFGGSKITADGDCSYEIKRCLLLARKVMTNLDNILKSRDITLPTKVHLVKAVVFPVWTVVLEKTRESLGQQGDPPSPS